MAHETQYWGETAPLEYSPGPLFSLLDFAVFGYFESHINPVSLGCLLGQSIQHKSIAISLEE